MYCFILSRVLDYLELKINWLLKNCTVFLSSSRVFGLSAVFGLQRPDICKIVKRTRFILAKSSILFPRVSLSGAANPLSNILISYTHFYEFWDLNPKEGNKVMDAELSRTLEGVEIWRPGTLPNTFKIIPWEWWPWGSSVCPFPLINTYNWRETMYRLTNVYGFLRVF